MSANGIGVCKTWKTVISINRLYMSFIENWIELFGREFKAMFAKAQYVRHVNCSKSTRQGRAIQCQYTIRESNLVYFRTQESNLVFIGKGRAI